MTCPAQLRPFPRHALSFAGVTEEQSLQGIHAVCLRCGAELRDSQQWFAEPCEEKKEEPP